jgi:hypothetical protein
MSIAGQVALMRYFAAGVWVGSGFSPFDPLMAIQRLATPKERNGELGRDHTTPDELACSRSFSPL